MHMCRFDFAHRWGVRVFGSLLFVVLSVLFVWKVAYIYNFLFSNLGEAPGVYRILWIVTVNDLPIYLVIVSLFLFGMARSIPYWMAVILRMVSVLVLVVYTIDLLSLWFFNTHVVMSDIWEHASYGIKYLIQIYPRRIFLIVPGLAILVVVVLLFVFGGYRSATGKKGFFVGGVSAFVMYVFSSYSASSMNYTHAWIFYNVMSYHNMVSSEAREYTPAFLSEFVYEERLECTGGVAEKPNIILLAVESLSSYQSKWFSGILDWTPNLDSIARNNLSYKNFYANGFTTEDAEIALLTGRLPVFPPASFDRWGGISFRGFFGVAESLPAVLRKNGYVTEFVTTADLSFSQTGKWARSIGFDYLEGHDHPYYGRWKRYQFNAAPDEALYDRILARVNGNKDKKYFIFSKTVSTHGPYIDPRTDMRSEEGAFRYADEQLGRFYRRLEQQGFFDDGMLIIVGDHHAMRPIRARELEMFGADRAPARVPLVVVYKGLRGIDERPYQQIDIPNTIKGLVSGTQCRSPWLGDLLRRSPPVFIAHRRADLRHIVSVFFEGGEGRVLLDGDETRLVVSGGLDPMGREIVVGKINGVRTDKIIYRMHRSGFQTGGGPRPAARNRGRSSWAARGRIQQRQGGRSSRQKVHRVGFESSGT